MKEINYILAIESSCDDTSIAAVDENGQILAEASYSQILLHRKFGGVVPELASRSHFDILNDLYTDLSHQLLKYDSLRLRKVVSTVAPGLVGPLIVGASFAKGLASGHRVPWEGIHHLRGHVASVLLSLDNPKQSLLEKAEQVFPAIVLLISGGHTQVLSVDRGLAAMKAADTADDAAGECFDKCAKLMGLPYPGGPEIEKMAKEMKDQKLANDILISLPKPKAKEGFSFSGLKTAVRLKLEKNTEFKSSPEFAWALQECIGQSLIQALNQCEAQLEKIAYKSFVFCGGVAANKRLRALIEEWAGRRGLIFHAPPIRYAMDNGAMIACAAWIQSSGFRLKDIEARRSLEHSSES